MEYKKVCIMGAGIGGLTVAHELAKYNQYEIHVYERNHVTGGQCSEYCWHAISPGYVNLFRVLSEIDDSLQHLKPLEKYYFLTNTGEHVDYNKIFLMSSPCDFLNSLEKVTGESHKLDIMRILWLYFKAQCMCEERLNSDYYDNIAWGEYVSNFSETLKKWIVDSTSVYLGMKYDEINTQLILDLLRHNQKSSLISSDTDFYSFDECINHVWFYPWKQLLRERGVIFHMRHDILDILIENDQIEQIIVKDNWWNKNKIVKADVYINGLGIESLAYLIKRIDFKVLAERSFQIQTQIFYRLPFSINEKYNAVYVLSDAPWFLMARYEKMETLSTCIGIWNRPGLNGKCAINCTPQELAEECWNQMLAFDTPIPVDLPEWDIWNNFEYSQEEKKIWTCEPTFSNNVGTLQLRPTNRDDDIQNLFHATAYTRTSMNVFNMESAVEAGVQTAKLISGSDIVVSDSYSPNWFFRIVQFFDRLLFRTTWCK